MIPVGSSVFGFCVRDFAYLRINYRLTVFLLLTIFWVLPTCYSC